MERENEGELPSTFKVLLASLIIQLAREHNQI